MSQAFTKEGDAADDFPERPVSDRPNYVTAAGLAALETLASELKAKASALPKDDPARKLAERDLRYYEARIASAILVPKPDKPVEARFGCEVVVEENGERRAILIVGEDEAAPEAGKLAWSSPLALALIGAKKGEERAFGERTFKIVAVTAP